MAVSIVVAVTDGDWFESLRHRRGLAEVNFWAPSGAPFKALQPGELFLFKLHAPRNYIVGGGIFAYANTLPCLLAWEAFAEANGAASFMEMRTRIQKYRKADPGDRSDFVVGCRILTQPFFFDEAEWLPVPKDWSPNIVSFKTYSTDNEMGMRLWEQVNAQLAASADETPGQPQPRYGEPVLVTPRLGQGTFRVLVTDVYHRRCAVTGERTLPALEAAHIRPYAEGGEHSPTNGLLLRRDIHSIFDAGYVTITPNYRFEVSHRIRDEFENGRDYYALHGREISRPDQREYWPTESTLTWHNENRFRG